MQETLGFLGLESWIHGSLKGYFLYLESSFEQNIKALSHIFNSVSNGVERTPYMFIFFILMFIFKKHFSPNLMLRNENIKDFRYNLVYFFNI